MTKLKQLTRERADAQERLNASKYWFSWWAQKFSDSPSDSNGGDLRLAMLRYQKDFAEVERLNREIHELMSESFHPAEIQSVMDNL